MKKRISFTLLTIFCISIFASLFKLPEVSALTTVATLSFNASSAVTTASGFVGDSSHTIYITLGVLLTTYTIYLDSTTTGHAYTIGTCATGIGVTCSLPFTIPHATGGNWLIHAESNVDNSNNTLTLTIVPQILSSSPSSGNVGTQIHITGTGFDAELLNIQLGTHVIHQVTLPAGIGGTFGDINDTTPITPIPAGTYPVHITGTLTGDITSSFTFTISPIISLSTNTGSIGAITQISGTGFAATSLVTIQQDNASTTTTVTTTLLGSFSLLNYTPTGTLGAHQVGAIDESGNTAPIITYTIRGICITTASSMQLPSITLHAYPVQSTNSLGLMTIIDNRNTNVGWSVTASISDFTSNTNTIPAMNVSINPNNSTLAVISGLDTGVSAGAAHQFSSSSDIMTFISATNGNGNGQYSIDPDVTLSIPVGTYTGTYTATLTQTIQ